MIPSTTPPSISVPAHPSESASLSTQLLHAVHLVRAEYHELPGLRLTEAQVARLLSLTPQETAQLLAALVREGLLACDERGAYRRVGL